MRKNLREEEKDMKQKIITFILFLFLIFNIFGLFSSAAESFGNGKIEEKTVCIVDEYYIKHVSDHGDSDKSEKSVYIKDLFYDEK